MNLVTAELKDKVLSVLCSWEDMYPEQYVVINTADFLKKADVNSRAAFAILNYFKRIGIIEDLSFMHSAPEFRLVINTEAFDIANRGGFVVQEQLLQKEVEKLLLEIERLKPTLGDKAEHISTIANNIAGITGTIIGAAVSIIGVKS